MSLLAAIVLIALGLVLAFAGRRFIWLLIGLAGFWLGYQLIAWVFSGRDPLFQLLAGLAVGVLGALLARRFTNVLLWIAGFVLVGAAVLNVGSIFGLGIDSVLLQVTFFVVGGLIGVALVRWALGLAIIIISALGGAAMVMQGLPALFNTTPGTLNLVIGIVVAVAGFIVQWRFLGESKDA